MKIMVAMVLAVFSQLGFSEVLGSFTKNNAVLAVTDAYAVWVEDENLLKIYMTPSKMTDEQKAKIDKGSPNYAIFFESIYSDVTTWTQNPFIVLNLSFRSDEIIESNLDSLSTVEAHAIDSSSTIATLTIPVDRNYRTQKSHAPGFEHVSFKEGELSLRLSGKSEGLGNAYSWSFDF